MTRPSDAAKVKRSYVVKWKGNVPTIEHSHWEVGYTPGHQETPQEAIAMEVAQLMKHIADFREKWLHLNVLAEQNKYQMVADAFGSILTVTETDDPHEQMTMPEGAQHVEMTYDNGPLQPDEVRGEDGLVRRRKPNFPDKAGSAANSVRNGEYADGEVPAHFIPEGYDDHPDH